MTLAAVLCCAMTTTVFTACGSDDDDNGNTQKPDDSLVAVQMNYTVETTQATLSIADVTVEYYDADGKIQSEPLTGVKWQKSIQHKLPATAGIHLKAPLKAGFDVENSEAVEISFTCGYDGFFINAQGGKSLLTVADKNTTEISTKSKRFPNFLAESNNILPVLYIFDAKGQYTSGTWE